jgi:hypothetical protein
MWRSGRPLYLDCHVHDRVGLVSVFVDKPLTDRGTFVVDRRARSFIRMAVCLTPERVVSGEPIWFAWYRKSPL